MFCVHTQSLARDEAQAENSDQREESNLPLYSCPFSSVKVPVPAAPRPKENIPGCTIWSSRREDELAIEKVPFECADSGSGQRWNNGSESPGPR